MNKFFIVKKASFFSFFIVCIFAALSVLSYYSFSSDYSFGSDLWIYKENFYDTHLDLNLIASPAYYFFSLSMSSLGFSFEFFRIVLFFLFYVAVLRQFYVLSNSHILVALLFFTVLLYPTYQSLSSLVLRQGLGIAFLMLIGFWGQPRSLKKRILLIIIAAFAHLSLLFYILPLYLSHKFTGLKFAFSLWIGIVIAYVLNVGLVIKNVLVMFLTALGLPYAEYALVEVDYTLGFNANFLLPSIAVILFLVVAKLSYRKLSEQSLYLLQFFFFANGIALLFSGFPYYDRLMIYSWVLVPLLLLSLFSNFRFYKTKAYASVKNI